MLIKSTVRSKLKAAIIHLCVTCIVALLVWQLIRFWYPGELMQIMGSFAIYKIIVMVELVLGPTMSLVVFSPEKSSKELCSDYVVIGLIQLSALLYGVFTVATARPAFLVLARDRLEIVRPIDIGEFNVNTEGAQIALSPFTSTQYLCVTFPKDGSERKKILISALGGKDIHRLPQYYRQCQDGEWFRGAKKIELLVSLMQKNGLYSSAIKDTLVEYEGCGWYPLITSFEIKTAIVCSDDNKFKTYLDFDSS